MVFNDYYIIRDKLFTGLLLEKHYFSQQGEWIDNFTGHIVKVEKYVSNENVYQIAVLKLEHTDYKEIMEFSISIKASDFNALQGLESSQMIMIVNLKIRKDGLVRNIKILEGSIIKKASLLEIPLVIIKQ